MIIQLKSENKYFLDLLYKNPNTDKGLYLKELKDGIVVKFFGLGEIVNQTLPYKASYFNVK